MKKIIGSIFAILLYFGGIGLGLYVCIWTMFIKPILDCCSAFDLGTLTGSQIFVTVLSCIFSGVVGGVIMKIGQKLSLYVLKEIL